MHKATALPHPRHGGRTLGERAQALLQFRYLALLTVVATYGLIVIGGTVRATDSGTACPDWPLCHGQVVPPLETKVLIEFSHRLAASLIGFMIAGTAFVIWRNHRQEKPLLRAGVAALAILAVQVIVGGVTVGTETAAGIVAVHLTIALSLLATLIFIAVWAFRADAAARPMSWNLGVVPLAAAIGSLALIISGAFVSQTGAGLAYPDWPLFDGKLVSAGGRLADLHYLHRIVAGVVGLLVLAYAVRVLRSDSPPVLLLAVAGAFVLYAVQVLVGASNVWLELPTSLRIVHLALASALWAVLAFTVIWAYQNGVRLKDTR